jgi:hypothetical protein
MAPRQLEANRANAQLSTGPVTPAGKQIVGQNALRHGLTGHVHAALPGEEEPFAQHTRALLEALAPVGRVEEELAQDIAADRWRLKRARAMENALFAQVERERFGELLPAAAHAEAWVDASKGLQRIALYANRIQRAIAKNTATLEAKQAERKAAHAQALEEAIALTEFAQSKGQTYDPAPDFPPGVHPSGFVYSAPEIARLISRARRLEEAYRTPPARSADVA